MCNYMVTLTELEARLPLDYITPCQPHEYLCFHADTSSEVICIDWRCDCPSRVIDKILNVRILISYIPVTHTGKEGRHRSLMGYIFRLKVMRDGVDHIVRL